MPINKDEIIAQIEKFIRNNGGEYIKWYVGTASDVSRKLFTVHGVDKAGGDYIYRPAENGPAAKEAADYFLNKGCIGDSGPGSSDRLFVYAYKTAGFTIESSLIKS